MPDSAAHILIVDDDPQVRRMLRRCLEGEGYAVSEAADESGVEAGLAAGANLITLDLNLGNADGLTIARQVRQRSDIPIIMITGKGDTIDRVVGLEVGADDYISKPFHLREVLARVRTVLRRTARPAGSDVRAPPRESAVRCIRFDEYLLDLDQRTLRDSGGSFIDLTSGEFDLLVVFAERAHRVMTRDQIMDLLKGHDWTPSDRSIDNMVARLRKKLGPTALDPALIKTVRGVGYSFTPQQIRAT